MVGNERGGLLDRLRTETKKEHERLEEGLDLLRPDLTLRAYAEILGRFYGFYRPWETEVGRLAGSLLPDAAARQTKVCNLMADLNYLGVDPDALPLCLAVPGCETVISALGGLYVTEGATLGGQLISRHLRRIFRFPEHGGDMFFRSYGGQVGAMWSSFRNVLSSYSSSTADDQIIGAAKGMFRALHQWLVEARP